MATSNCPEHEADAALFFKSIDAGLVRYLDELLKVNVTSENTLRYLRPREVRQLDIPEVYKRMLINEICNLQTPDSKKRMKCLERSPTECKTQNAASGNTRVRLEFSLDNRENRNERGESSYDQSGNRPVTRSGAGKSAVDSELDRINEERECLTLVLNRRKMELTTLKSQPLPLQPLPIPGNVLMKTVCDKCHHRGHRATGNKNNKDCPFIKCEGFHYCGIENKHKEHKQMVTEVRFYIIY